MSENALLFYGFVSLYSICVPWVLFQTKFGDEIAIFLYFPAGQYNVDIAVNFTPGINLWEEE